MSHDQSKRDPDLKAELIYRAANPAQAHIINMALSEAGIRAIIEGETLGVVVGEVPPWDAQPRIFVPESQAVAARSIIHKVKRQTMPAPTRPHPPVHAHESACLACGHAMDETQTRCPSCGWSFE
jgi:hypothetical protein